MTTHELTQQLRRQETLLRESRQELEDGQSDGELSDHDLSELEETVRSHRRQLDMLRQQRQDSMTGSERTSRG